MAKAKTKQEISNLPKFIGVLLLFSLVLLIVTMNYSKGLKSGPSIDTAVSTIKAYLKRNYLRDPSSYEAIDNYGFEKRNDGEYQVFHHFRANNGFGGKNEETILFILSGDCKKVIRMRP